MPEPRESAAAKAGGAKKKLDDAEAERRLATIASIVIPGAAIGGAIVVGAMFTLASAILVLAAGALLGTIALMWASLRTLSGDAPLPLELEALAVRSHSVDNLAEQKRRVMRALKDLELEHSVGKIDDSDYAELGEKFRGQAKALMRQMDEQIDPLRAEAEEIAQKHLAKKGLGPEGRASRTSPTRKAAAKDQNDAAEKDDAAPESIRKGCPKCKASNEPDAAFCKKCGAGLATEESHA